MASDLPYKLQTFSITKLLLLTREYQYADIQSLTHQIILKPLLINFNYLLQHIRKSMQKIHKLSLQTNNSIEEIITITTITVATTATPYTTTTNRNHAALYVIGKDITHRDILRRSKKSLKPSLELLIETGLANLMTNLRNDLINILQIIRMIILTQKKSLRKLFKY